MVIKKLVYRAGLLGLATFLAATHGSFRTEAQELALLTKPSGIPYDYQINPAEVEQREEKVKEKPIPLPEKVFRDSDVDLAYLPKEDEYLGKMSPYLRRVNENSLDYIIANQLNLTFENLSRHPFWGDVRAYIGPRYSSKTMKSFYEMQTDMGKKAIQHGFEDAGKVWAERNILPQFKTVGRTLLESLSPIITIEEIEILGPEDDPVYGQIGEHRQSEDFKRWGFNYGIFDLKASLLFKPSRNTMLNLKVDPGSTEFMGRAELSPRWFAYAGARYDGIGVTHNGLKLEPDFKNRFSAFAGFRKKFDQTEKKASSFGLDFFYDNEMNSGRGAVSIMLDYTASF